MTSTKRLLKQLLYAFLLLFLIFGSMIWSYFGTIMHPECFNGRLDTSEEGIDCGGVCSPCVIIPPPPGVENFKQIRTVIIPLRNNSYDLVAEIQNPNKDWGAKSLYYKFSLYGEKNEFIADFDGVDFIMPAASGEEYKYIVRHINDVNGQPKIAKLELTKIVWQSIPSYIKRPKFSVSYEVFNNTIAANGIISAEGVVENASLYDFNNIFIKVIITGESGDIVGAASTNMNTMRSYEKRYFKVTWDEPFREKVKDNGVKWYVETNILDSDNFIKKTYESIPESY